MRDDRGWPGGDLLDQQRGFVVAAEAQLFAELFGIDIDATFFDFEPADAACAKMFGNCPNTHWHDVVDFKGGECGVDDSFRPREICRTRAQGTQPVFRSKCTLKFCS